MSSIRRSRRPLVLILVACGTTMTTIALAGAPTVTELGSMATPVQYAPTTGIVGPGESVIDAVAAARLGLLPGDLVDSTPIASPPNQPNLATGLPWLHMTIRLPVAPDGDVSGKDMLPLWEGDLMAGATAERLATTQPSLAGVLGGVVEQGELPDGSVVDVASGTLGATARGQVFPDQDASDADIVAKLTTVVRALGLTPLEIRVLRPLGAAPLVRAAVANIADAGNSFYKLNQALLGSPASYEGLYFELDDSAGRPLAITTAALRAGTGGLWVRPGLPVDLGTGHG